MAQDISQIAPNMENIDNISLSIKTILHLLTLINMNLAAVCERVKNRQ